MVRVFKTLAVVAHEGDQEMVIVVLMVRNEKLSQLTFGFYLILLQIYFEGIDTEFSLLLIKLFT